jgi:hypothetical protein
LFKNCLKLKKNISYLPFSGNINNVKNHPEKLGNHAELMARMGFVNYMLAITGRIIIGKSRSKNSQTCPNFV